MDKLHQTLVDEVKRLLAETDLTHMAIARRLPISVASVGTIARGFWGTICTIGKLDRAVVDEVKRLLAETVLTQRAIAQQLGIHPDVVSLISREKGANISTIEALLKEVRAQLDRFLSMEPEPVQRFMSVKQAAVYSGLSRDTIRGFVESGDLTALRPGGGSGKIVLDREELDAFFSGSTRHPVNDRSAGLAKPKT